nr:hypothetical protein [Tanacetum cinerariifolium]
MSTSTFAETHNLIAFLEKPTEIDGFEQIVDFLNANLIKYALTVSPTIYTSCTKQFWTSIKVETINKDVRLQALVDGKKVIINEASIRRDLRLDDAEGTACLPNAVIFEELARIGEKEEQSEKVVEKEVSTADPVTSAGEVVTTADVEVSAALTTTTTIVDELTLAQTLIEIKTAKPKMVEPERPLKRKEQIMIDEQIARDLEA